MTERPESQVSESRIAVHWREEEYYYPPEKFVTQANAADPSIFDRFSEDKFPDCFKEYADLLSWDAPWHTTLDTSNPPFWKWFSGGRLNASYNCVDRHAEASPRRGRPEDGRPGDPAHADGARAAGDDAGLRQARHHSLAGVRRVQR